MSFFWSRLTYYKAAPEGESISRTWRALWAAYRFDPALNRTVGVNKTIVLEALDTACDADHLPEELTIVE